MERKVPEHAAMMRGRILPYACFAIVCLSVAAQVVAMWVTDIHYKFFPLYRDHFGFAGFYLALSSLPLAVLSTGVLRPPALCASLNATALWFLSVMYFI